MKDAPERGRERARRISGCIRCMHEIRRGERERERESEKETRGVWRTGPQELQKEGRTSSEMKSSLEHAATKGSMAELWRSTLPVSVEGGILA